MSGCLWVVPTPIGNLQDITLRALTVLSQVAVIVAEDTRAAQHLLQAHRLWPLGAGRKLVSYFEGNAVRRTPELLACLQQGQDIALVSEAGMPGISDPGQRLIEAAYAQGAAVDVLPGPCAAVTALVLSGMSAPAFTFMGFAPRRGAERDRWFSFVAHSVVPLVLYEAPTRIQSTLETLVETLGAERPACLTRELTKIHQTCLRASLGTLRESVRQSPPKGEITLIVAGAAATASPFSTETLEKTIAERLQQGDSAKEIANALALQHGKPKRWLYQEVLRAQRKTTAPILSE